MARLVVDDANSGRGRDKYGCEWTQTPDGLWRPEKGSKVARLSDRRATIESDGGHAGARAAASGR